MGALVVQLLEPLEPKFVFGLFILNVSELFKLIVTDLESPSIHKSTVHILKSLLSLVWSLEAHKSICLFSFVNWEQLHTFNLAIVLEHLTQVFVSASWFEVFDVQITALFGVFILNGLTK